MTMTMTITIRPTKKTMTNEKRGLIQQQLKKLCRIIRKKGTLWIIIVKKRKKKLYVVHVTPPGDAFSLRCAFPSLFVVVVAFWIINHHRLGSLHPSILWYENGPLHRQLLIIIRTSTYLIIIGTGTVFFFSYTVASPLQRMGLCRRSSQAGMQAFSGKMTHGPPPRYIAAFLLLLLFTTIAV